jgi:hypothetical protein
MGLEHERHVLIADDPASFARNTIRLYHDKTTWLHLQEEGFAFVEQNYSREGGRRICKHILDLAFHTWTARRQAAREACLAELRQRDGHGSGLHK